MRFNTIHKTYNGIVNGVDQEGFTVPMDEWTMDECKAAARAADRNGFDTVADMPKATVLHLTPEDFGDGFGYGGSGDESDRDGQDADGDADGQGDGQGDESDGDADGQSDGESDQDGESGDESDGESGDQSDQEQSDDESDGKDDMDFQFEHDPGEDESLGDKFADSLWETFKPRVIDIAESRARQAGNQVRESIPKGGTGGKAKPSFVKIDGKVKGKIPEVRHSKFDTVLRLVARGTHVYLPGPPGTGKSHMCLQVGEALGRSVEIEGFNPMSPMSDIKGYMIPGTGEFKETAFYRAFTSGGLYVGDELDNSNPAIVAGLNSALANGIFEFGNGKHLAHLDFGMLATANTLGTGPTAQFAGRAKLDPASLNRFAKVYIDTDERMETAIVAGMLGDSLADRWLTQVRHARRAVDALGIKHFVTMRDSVIGAKMIAPGDGAFTIGEACEMTFLGALDDDQKAKIKAWS